MSMYFIWVPVRLKIARRGSVRHRGDGRSTPDSTGACDMRSIFLAGLAVAAIATGASAQDDPHVRALSAGYKAAFLCSGVFNAGRPEAEIAADDLEGIYPAYQELVRTLPAVVDRAGKTVSVAFDPKLPPRVAAWRPNLGCAQLPIGAPPEGAAKLPRLDMAPPAPRSANWPD